MSSFSSEWLDAREPVDFAARSPEVLAAVTHYFANDEVVRITDIGCGTGSTIRAIKPMFFNELQWHLIDQDNTLLDRAKGSLKNDPMVFSTQDLSSSIDIVFEHKPTLVTTSAFLDLVSMDWLSWFCEEITKRKLPFYAALTYDGRAICQPEHIHDRKVLDTFNQHQLTNKGFGPALGPDAAAATIRLFEEAGYLVTSEPSDWIGDDRHPEFQKMLLEGWYEAACEIEPEKAGIFREWLKDRLYLVNNGTSTIQVGHQDIFAIPQE